MSYENEDPEAKASEPLGNSPAFSPPAAPSGPVPLTQSSSRIIQTDANGMPHFCDSDNDLEDFKMTTDNESSDEGLHFDDRLVIFYATDNNYELATLKASSPKGLPFDLDILEPFFISMHESNDTNVCMVALHRAFAARRALTEEGLSVPFENCYVLVTEHSIGLRCFMRDNIRDTLTADDVMDGAGANHLFPGPAARTMFSIGGLPSVMAAVAGNPDRRYIHAMGGALIRLRWPTDVDTSSQHITYFRSVTEGVVVSNPSGVHGQGLDELHRIFSPRSVLQSTASVGTIADMSAEQRLAHSPRSDLFRLICLHITDVLMPRHGMRPIAQLPPSIVDPRQRVPMNQDGDDDEKVESFRLTARNYIEEDMENIHPDELEFHRQVFPSPEPPAVPNSPPPLEVVPERAATQPSVRRAWGVDGLEVAVPNDGISRPWLSFVEGVLPPPMPVSATVVAAPAPPMIAPDQAVVPLPVDSVVNSSMEPQDGSNQGSVSMPPNGHYYMDDGDVSEEYFDDEY